MDPKEQPENVEEMDSSTEESLSPGSEDLSREPAAETAKAEGESGEGAEDPAQEPAPADAEDSRRALQHLVAEHEDGRDRVEALIFAAEEALDEEKLAELLGFGVDEVLACIHRLNEDYTDSRRSFRLKRLAGGWQLVSRSRYGEDIRRLLKVQVRHRLSRAALETLAVIAYKQPITKSEVESLRGVASDGVLKTLLDRRLVVIRGRSKAVGKPLLYGTTREFLEYFGLEDLKEMPRLKEIKELMAGRDSGEENLPAIPVNELLPGPDPADAEMAAARGGSSGEDAVDEPTSPATGEGGAAEEGLSEDAPPSHPLPPPAEGDAPEAGA